MKQENAKKIQTGSKLIDKENPEWGTGTVTKKNPQGLVITWSRGPAEFRPFRYFATVEHAPRETK